MTTDSLDPDEMRRRLIAAGLGFGLANSVGGATIGARPLSPSATDEGAISDDRIRFPPIQSDSETPGAPAPSPDPPEKRVGFAVMGLGRLALENILPAFAQAKHARLIGLISGDPQKMATVAAQYGIRRDACYDYEQLPILTSNKVIEAVYVVLPNALHRNATVDLAKAGKHVLCEKPMATNAQEARDMIAACKAANRKLMIAYRCQYEVANRELARRARGGELGSVQIIESVNTQNQADATQWRQVKSLAGGGSLPDVGLYCLNTTRALLGEEPSEVMATIYSPPGDPLFKEVESTVSFVLKFPSGVIANCASSYSVHQKRSLSVLGSKAHARIDNAFAYTGQKLHISQREGDAEVIKEFRLTVQNQFALELDHFATCIRDDRRPRTPGEEGLQDQIIMAAIYESARSGRVVQLQSAKTHDAFRGPEL